MDINDEIEMTDLEYKVRDLEVENKELKKTIKMHETKQLNILGVRQSFFNEVYDKWIELVDDTEFTSYLNSNCK